MVQVGAGLSGFALYALMMWMPIWRLAVTSTPDGLAKYFLVVMMLVFGVFMVSGGRSKFSFKRFAPAFVAGALGSAGFAAGSWPLMISGGIALFVLYFLYGE